VVEHNLCVLKTPNKTLVIIQGVSEGIINILGGGSMDYSE